MSYIFLNDERRLLDPESGHELVVRSSGSDMTVLFQLISPGGTYDFAAHKVFPVLSNDEKERFGVTVGQEAIVWQVYNWNRTYEQEIKRALLANKAGAGYQYPGSVYFVQFGLNGNLQNV